LRFPELQKKPYRPENLLLFLACQPNLAEYLDQKKEQDRKLGPEVVERDEEGDNEVPLALPEDVLRRIAELKPSCAKKVSALTN
jgi:hypothetical protein